MGIGTRWILGHGNNQDNRSRHKNFSPNIDSNFLSMAFFEKFQFSGDFSRMWKSWTCFDPLTSASRRDQKRFCKCDGKEGHASTELYINTCKYTVVWLYSKVHFYQLLRKFLKYVNGIFLPFLLGNNSQTCPIIVRRVKSWFLSDSKAFQFGHNALL